MLLMAFGGSGPVGKGVISPWQKPPSIVKMNGNPE
jgi:hypothetical protein